ncbi:MAG: ABC transporter ATP-binding protein [Pseudomonadota bacterium]
MSRDLYQVRDLIHAYGPRRVLDVPGLDIPQGAVIGLAGPNGSGKSSLLRLLAFLEAPSQGQVIFAGAPRGPDTPGARQGVTLLLQEPYLLKRGVAANLAYGLRLRGQGRPPRAELDQALAWVGLEPDQFARRRWYQLSGGEAKRVALAARLVLKPRVLLLDEPTAGVDAPSAELISRAALAAREQWGTTLVVASHDLAWLARTVDRVWGLQYGRLAAAPPAPRPPAREAPAGALHLQEPRGKGAGRRVLACRVSCLALEEPGGRGRVELDAGQGAYCLRLPLDDLAGLGLTPGQEVWLVLEDQPA